MAADAFFFQRTINKFQPGGEEFVGVSINGVEETEGNQNCLLKEQFWNYNYKGNLRLGVL